MSEHRAFFGTIALSTVNAARLGLQLLVLPILARILGPDTFGLVGLAIPIVLLAGMMCDAGMGNALVRHPNPSWELESTAFWLSLGAGMGLTIVVYLLAWPLAAAFSQPALGPVLASLSLIITIGGALAVSNARISRSRNFGIFAVGELLALILCSAAGIYAAVSGWGYWSLVVQQLVLWLTKTLWLFPVAGFRPGFYFKPSLAKPFIRFGLNSVAANITDFIGKNIPSLVVGGALGVNALGHYSMANQLARVPEMVISGPVNLSTFTAVAQLRSDEEVRSFVMRSLRMIATVSAALFGGLYVTADLATNLLLGAKWIETAPVLAALAPAAFCLCLYSFMGAVLLGLGNSSRQFKLTLLLGIAMFIGALAGTRFGVVAVGTGLSVGAVVLAPLYVQALSRELRLAMAAIVSTAVAPIAAAVVMGCVVYVLRGEIAHLSQAVQLLIAVGAGMTSFVVALACFVGRQFLDDLRSLHPRVKAVSPPEEELLSFDGPLLAERIKK